MESFYTQRIKRIHLITWKTTKGLLMMGAMEVQNLQARNGKDLRSFDGEKF